MKSALWRFQRRLIHSAARASPASNAPLCIARRSVTISTTISRCAKLSNQPFQQLGFQYSSSTQQPDRCVAESESEDEADEVWEEDEAEGIEPRIGDGGDGGGIVLLDDVPWGRPALSIAQEIFLSYDDLSLFSFKMSPRGYIYLRLDKLSNKYGCPSMEEIENFTQSYKTKLDEAGERGDIPDDLALEVSSPGAERLLKIPDDLERFKELPMRVRYTDKGSNTVDSVFLLDAVDTVSANCSWKLANVKENRVGSKGRPFTRKRKDWRLELPFSQINKVSLYLEF